MKAIPLALVLVLALAGCSTATDSIGAQPAPTARVPMPAGAKEVRSLDAPSVDTSCGNPQASLRPTGPLPAPGAFAPGSTMATIHQQGKLVVGVDQNTLGFGYRDPRTGELVGFALEMAKEVARAIFGDPNAIQLRVLTSKQREDALRNGDVDLVAHTMTVNCERWGWADFSTVYFMAAQKVLVKNDFDYQSVESLAGRTVCATEGSTSLARIVNEPVTPKPVGMQVAGWTDCLVMLQQNQVDAVSTDNTILAGLAQQDPFTRVVGDSLADEPYALAMPNDREDFVRFVNAVLERIRADGTWTRLYDLWLSDLLGATSGPPPIAYQN
jgi:polar amino acid transport system substrate-binding protein